MYKKPALKIVAAENALAGLESPFNDPLVAVDEVATVVPMENLEQRLLLQSLRSSGGRVDLTKGQARFHEAVGHGGRENGRVSQHSVIPEDAVSLKGAGD